MFEVWPAGARRGGCGPSRLSWHFRHIRCFAWMLILVLSVGLAAPAFAALSENGRPSMPAVTHLHDDGYIHSHGVVPTSDGNQPAAATRPAKAPLHCPHCATLAECAVSCFGVAVLPTSVLIQAYSSPHMWLAADLATPSGVAPFGDIDPPRPVSVR